MMWSALLAVLACGPKTKTVPDPPVPAVVPKTELSGSPSAPTETKGIRSVEVLGQIHLNAEFEGFQSDTLMRFRRLTIEPGGVVAQHEHQQRPGVAYILSGTITEHRNGEVRVCHAGDLAYESSGVTHWWTNPSKDEVVAVVVDIVQSEHPPDIGAYHSVQQSGSPPIGHQGITVTALGQQELSGEFSALNNKILRVRHIDVAPDGTVAFHTHQSRPSFAYLLGGEMSEHRTDRTEAIVHYEGAVVSERNGLGHWWENTSGHNAQFLVVDIVAVETD